MGRKAVEATFTNQQIIDAATGRWGTIAHEVKPAEPYHIQRPDADDIVIAPLTRARRKQLKAAQAAYMLTGGQLADAQREGDASQEVISRIQTLLEKAEESYDRALFGDSYDELVAYYDPLQEEFWDAMYQDVHDLLVNRVPTDDHRCQRCGRPFDEDAEGKDESSSTSSSDTGTPSSETSGASSG